METKRRRHATARLVFGLVALVSAATAQAQTTDFCGCAGSPSLGAFVSNDASTFPPGTVSSLHYFTSYQPGIAIPLPPDGVLVFDSFVVNMYPGENRYTRVLFRPNAANTPVTLLVKGDVTIYDNSQIWVGGWAGGTGSAGNAGGPGQGGPGGFAGGQGAFEVVNFAEIGGNGVGPGGGLGATIDPLAVAQGGTFIGVPELRPLLGGSGGGGGRSVAGTTNAAAGGGGGGGGAILIVANGTIDIRSGGSISATGGSGGNRFTNPATAGAGGSGGAIRLLANRIQGAGNIYARGGGAGSTEATFGANAGLEGRIRMEALFDTFAADNTDPLAVRAPAPGPLVNPITPTVRITGVDGAAAPPNPIGFQNAMDMVVEAPGVIQVDLATSDVPAGTDVAVTVKPKIGGLPTTQNVTLASCSAGACTAAASFDLGAGAYIVEARATFQTP